MRRRPGSSYQPFEQRYTPPLGGLLGFLFALSGCGGAEPPEQVSAVAQAVTSCAAPSVSCVPGEPEPAECGAAPCLIQEDSSLGCCTPPPPIVEVSTPGAGNICVSTTLVRTSGPPNEKTYTFDVPCPSSAEDRYTMVVNNGSGTASLGASAVWIALNGKQILSPRDFNNQVMNLESPVTLTAGTNKLTVRLASTPGSSVTVGIRKAPFQISVGAPLPGQCLNHPPTVTGTTTAACIAVSANGQAGTISGNAITVAEVPLIESDQADILTRGADWCNNTSTDDRKVVYDITPPVITTDGYTPGEIRNQDITPAFAVTDLHLVARSGVLTLTTGPASLPRGAADTTTIVPFESGQTLTAEGDYELAVHGADCAGNESQIGGQRFTIDKTAPLLTIAGVTHGQSVRDATLTPTFTAADRDLLEVSAALAFLPSDGGAATSAPFTSGTTLSAAGQYALTVQAKDRAGNIGTATVEFSIAVCGNGVVEAGEQCEAGACCAACDLLPDGAACASSDSCNTVHACQAGVCLGSAPNGTCNTSTVHVAAGAAAQTVTVPGLDLTVPENLSITWNDRPLPAADLVIDQAIPNTNPEVFVPSAAMPEDFVSTDLYHLEPSGAQFSPPLQFAKVFDPETNAVESGVEKTPAALLCDDAGDVCEELEGQLSDVIVDGRVHKRLVVEVSHFSTLIFGYQVNRSAVGSVAANRDRLGAKPTFANRSGWMGGMSQAIGNLKLHQLFLPGSHDSGTYSMRDAIAQDITQAQGTTIKEQLEQGIRYFDLRVAHACPCQKNFSKGHKNCRRVSCDDAKYFGIHHGGWLTNVPLSDVLTAVRSHIDAHPQEIVILEMTHFNGFGDPGSARYTTLVTRLNDTIQSNLGDVMIQSGQISKTLNELWSLKRRVLVISDSWGEANSAGIWNPEPIQNPWFDKASVGALEPRLEAEVQAAFDGLDHPTPSNGKAQPANPVRSSALPLPWILQAQLTPDGDGGALLWIKAGADLLNPKLFKWFGGQNQPGMPHPDAKPHWDTHVNIAIFDYVGWTDFGALAERNNKLRDPCKDKACGSPDGLGGFCMVSTSSCDYCVPSCTNVPCGQDNGCGRACEDLGPSSPFGQCCTPDCSGQLCGAPTTCGGTCQQGSGCSPTYCLEVVGNNSADWTNVQLGPCNGFLGQRWTAPASTYGDIRSTLERYEPFGPPTPLCLDVYMGGTADDTNVQSYRCNTTPAQKWRYTSAHELRSSLDDNKCLDVAGGVLAAGANVRIMTCNGSDAQKWFYTANQELRSYLH